MTYTEDLCIFHPDLETPAVRPAVSRGICEVLDHPPKLTARLAEVCSTISSHAPAVAPCRPFRTAAFARCYTNVELLVAAFGGRLASGWSIWEDRGLLLNCEHHAVWRTPEGELLCVTPQLRSEREIVFVLQKEWDEIPTGAEFRPHILLHVLPLHEHPQVRAICDLLAESSRWDQGSAPSRELRVRAIAMRDQFLRRERDRSRRRERDRSRRRERRRRGRKG